MPAHSLVTGPGLAGATAGLPALFRLVPCDRFGNACAPDLERDRPVATVMPADLPPPALSASAAAAAAAAACPVEVCVDGGRADEPGCYVFRYTPSVAVTHRLSVSLASVALPNSPWRVRVRAGPPSALHSRLFPRHGRAAVAAGTAAEFLVILVDWSGNACTAESARDAVVTATAVAERTSAAAEAFALPAEAAARGAEGASWAAAAAGGAADGRTRTLAAEFASAVECADCGDGRWLVRIVSTRAGTYGVRAAVNGEPLGGARCGRLRAPMVRR